MVLYALKGKYNAMRMVQLVVNALLFLAMLACMIGGLFVSQHIFAIGNGSAIEFGRHLHLVATAWAFILMSIHDTIKRLIMEPAKEL